MAGHLPHLVYVHALVGWAGWGRLCEGGCVQDSLGPGVHCGLGEHRRNDERSEALSETLPRVTENRGLLLHSPQPVRSGWGAISAEALAAET